MSNAKVNQMMNFWFIKTFITKSSSWLISSSIRLMNPWFIMMHTDEKMHFHQYSSLFRDVMNLFFLMNFSSIFINVTKKSAEKSRKRRLSKKERALVIRSMMVNYSSIFIKRDLKNQRKSRENVDFLLNAAEKSENFDFQKRNET